MSNHSTIPRRRFGRTGIDIPVFSCGGMRYQHAWQDNDPSEIPADSQQNVNACIRRAVELGINHIETARGYGTSEVQLGPVLKQFPRHELIIQTKVGPKDSGEEFITTVEKSLKNLQIDHVELLAVHGINNRDLLDQVMRPGGTLEAVVALKKKGVARSIGFSTHAPVEVIQQAISLDVFDYINLHWYFVFEANWPAILDARTHDMGVFIISPNDKGGKLYEPTPEMIELCRPLSPMQFNNLYCLSRPEVHTLSIGAARPSDFDDHIAGLRWYEVRQEVTASIASGIRKEMENRLGAEWCAQWSNGLPPWEEVPGKINLREIIRLWNFATALGMDAYAKMRYNLLGQGDHWFPGVHAGQMDEQAILEKLKDYPFAHRIPDLLRDAHVRFYEAPKKRLSES